MGFPGNGFIRSPQFREEIEQQRKRQTEDDGCRDGKIETKTWPLDSDIAWQLPQERNCREEIQHQTDEHKKDAESDEGFSKNLHGLKYCRVQRLLPADSRSRDLGDCWRDSVQITVQGVSLRNLPLHSHNRNEFNCFRLGVQMCR